MKTFDLSLRLVVVLLIVLANAHRTQHVVAAELTQDDLVTLVKLGIEDGVILAKVKKDGLGFQADEQALAIIKDAGASEEILKAVIEAAKSKPATTSAPAVTFPDLLKLLQLGIDEDAIIKRLAKSPTVFTLGDDQSAELTKAGASDELIAMLKGVRPATPQAAELITDIAIILDCSGSMRESTSEGQTKMAVAKSVVTDLVQKIPDGLNVTFVIYGHEVFGSADDPRNCQAVKVARPLSKLDPAGKSELAAVISALQPTGATPIALSLRTAAAELAKNDAFCGLVLITDGQETCKGDPAGEAAELAKNPKLTFGVNVIGFDVKPEERTGLQAIASAGNGKYYNAESAGEFSAAIAEVRKELEQKAMPAPRTTSGRRAIKILQPQIELPSMKAIVLTKPDGSIGTLQINKLSETVKYGEEIRLPSADKFDVWWVPQDGLPIRMLKDFAIAERNVVEVKPESYLGMLQINGEGLVKPKAIVLTASDQEASAGTANIYKTQSCDRYGKVMVVSAAAYDLWIVPADGGPAMALEKKLTIEPGKLLMLE